MDKATNSGMLERRLELNRAHTKRDFNRWLLDHLKILAADHVLEVGCGTGAQTVPIAAMVGMTGCVHAIDVSPHGIEVLRTKTSHMPWVVAQVLDMDVLTPAAEKYDLALSVYALYYAKNPASVLDVMRRSLKPDGRCAVCVPLAPNGLVELASRFSRIPKAVTASLEFGPQCLWPYFNTHFADAHAHTFHNSVSFTDPDDVVDFYRQTTYYDEHAEAQLSAAVQREIECYGSFDCAKNSYLVVGGNG